MSKIIPTILTADEDEYHEKLRQAEHLSDLIQVDVIDGKFAKNYTIGTDVILKYPSSSNLEIQLMCVYPQNYIDELVFADFISRIIIPFEGQFALNDALYHVKRHAKKVGLSINPETPISAAIHFLDDIDFLLLLGVAPGFSGQKFQEHVVDKVRQVKKINPGLAVEVDGGINFENTPKLVAAGADFLAVNAAIWKSEDFYLAYEKLAKLASLSS